MSTTVLAFILILLAVGARVLASNLLLRRKEELRKLVAALGAARANLEHARERRKAAEQLVGFYERQKIELHHKITETQEDLEKLESGEGREEEEEEGKEEDPHEIRLSRDRGRGS